MAVLQTLSCILQSNGALDPDRVIMRIPQSRRISSPLSKANRNVPTKADALLLLSPPYKEIQPPQTTHYLTAAKPSHSRKCFVWSWQTS